MQTAATTSSTRQPLNFSLSSDDISTKYYVILHFADIASSNGSRKFSIYVNGRLMSPEYIPSFLSSSYINYTLTGFTNYNVSMVATSSSTLPPLLNAIELYTVAPLWGPTDAGDVAAINRIKVFYNITKGWSGDPCLPTQFLWTGVDCSTNSNITRITGLKLSSSGLTGLLSDDFGNLTALVSLDLSSNNLSGSLPTSLDNLTALTYLDIRGNSKISTVLPPGLQRKQQDGSLKYRFGDISLSPSASAKKNVIIAIAVVVSLLIMAIAIGTIFGLKRKKYNRTIVAKPNENYESGPDHARNYVNISQAEIRKGELESKGVSNFEDRKFRYKDLKRITNGLKNKIGTGGFGSVYLGLLENEFQVAVKIRSQSSKQGVKEFMAEAENLARVHHKNLVSLVGYCIDKSFMALVYEYMPEGNLHDKIKDNEKPLAWKQRLQIAYESALGTPGYVAPE
ncbi:Leucine-rich repeat protein kinase family protein [Rhynchospora pubera]|uniref:non-specific serine/threonine protein kinase n=1 Tax=Rhynchospora pubera TaxID=906938 RepID=A0AAV8HU81_9POAL|nr:Leucine-rich repeat protein kinase family protein [Rhynchospora pubera]